MSTLNTCGCSRSAGRTPCRPWNDIPRSSIRSTPPIVGTRLVAVIHARVQVRPAAAADLVAINDIYNRYVNDSHFTFDLEPVEMDVRREWFGHYSMSGRYRLFVAVDEDEGVGYASSSRFRPKPGYATSAETSIYLAPDPISRGPGSTAQQTQFTAHAVD